jgi:hypothetical protein
MRTFALVLKLLSPIFILVGCLHLVLGANSEVLLGATMSLEVLSDPVVDSQNRFYGVAFTLYGFLHFLCATDISKYQTVLRTLLWVFFAAGCARIVSLVTHGIPSNQVLVLLSTELLLPPLGIVWLRKSLVSL